MRGLGRINRATYWVAIIIVFAIGLGVGHVAPRESGFANLLLVLVAVPRLHDIGKSGWWAVVVLVAEFFAGLALGTLLPPAQTITAIMGIAIVVGVMLIVLGVLRGQPQTNRFGAPPKSGLSYAPPGGL